jgi:hypothetical protein
MCDPRFLVHDLLWPVLFWVNAINASLSKQMDKMDPAIHARQAARIKELERELEIDV